MAGGELIKAVPKTGFFKWVKSWFTSGAEDAVKSGQEFYSAGKTAVKAAGHGVSAATKIGTGTAIVTTGVVGSGMALDGVRRVGTAVNNAAFGGNAPDESSHSRGSFTAVEEAAKSMGITFGIGSLIGGGLLYAAGHFLLGSPGFGIALAAIGALVGQPIVDAVEAGMKKGQANAPATAPAKQPSGPAQQQSTDHAPELSEEAKKQADAARNSAVSGGQTTTSRPIIQTTPAQSAAPSAGATPPGP